jgi:hypothetical protein
MGGISVDNSGLSRVIPYAREQGIQITLSAKFFRITGISSLAFAMSFLTGCVKTSWGKAFLRLTPKVYRVGAVEIVTIPEGVERDFLQ